MTGRILTTTASSYYVEFDGIAETEIKSMAQVSYEGKVTGNAKPIACTKGGRTSRQTTSGGYDSSPSMTLEVYMCDDPRSASFQFYNWFQDCLPPSDGGTGNWASSRKTGSVVVYDPQSTEVLRWNLEKAWIKKYSISDPDVTGQDLAVETYELVAENIYKPVSISSAF
ncbi:MAG: phage tail protein [Pseudanabaenales cyanobacterium]|nr:phage tail protein [Pseudanabaenales cyanobacterium]